MEEAVAFLSRGKRLYGILHLPGDRASIDQIVLMVVGGPQTRVGSHRLYVQIARALCDQGTAVFRFDYEGLGDSDGDFVGFRGAGESIGSALDYVYDALPNLKKVVLWSLCDGATAGAVYASNDGQRIHGLILNNPYVETEQGKAKTVLKYYYIRRIMQREFWAKMLARRIHFRQSLASFIALAKKASSHANGKPTDGSVRLDVPLPDQIAQAMREFAGPICVLLSTNDLTAMEFRDMVGGRRELSGRSKKGMLSIRYIEKADHTFSRAEYKRMLIEETLLALEEFGGTN